MAQNQILPVVSELDRYHLAAADLATIVDVIDRLASDASIVAERSPLAERMRAQMLATALEEFRAATVALHADADTRELRRNVDVTAELAERDL